MLFYYRLTNFYQNHRRYVKSLDSDQLKGVAKTNDSIAHGSCEPLANNTATGKVYYPCGLIANSVFNDTFRSPVQVNVGNSNANNETYQMTDKGIAWDSDKALYGKTKYTWDQVSVPPNWAKRFPKEGYTEKNQPPNLAEMEHLHVWMRTAGLPTFSKLAMRNDDDVMRSGTYQVDIELSEIYLSSMRHLNKVLTRHRFPSIGVWGHKVYCYFHHDGYGRKESFPGNCLRCGRWDLRSSWGTLHRYASDQTEVRCNPPKFQILKLKFILRKLGDHTYLSWNNDQPSTAIATGRDNRPGNDTA